MWFDALSAMWLALVVACAAVGGYRRVAFLSWLGLSRARFTSPRGACEFHVVPCAQLRTSTTR